MIGSVFCAKRKTLALGILEKTSNGPVKSSWVTPGKMKIPMEKDESDMAGRVCHFISKLTSHFYSERTNDPEKEAGTGSRNLGAKTYGYKKLSP
ncbi:hypothetical protein [Leptospira gomenensis]|uniref:hypothetical protein n=1 Tax=Leptospira gomenensis TaxID=2484974 RepID=UPI001FE910D4|nr:hypothetical protein [Leptospira gomenensis]